MKLNPQNLLYNYTMITKRSSSKKQLNAIGSRLIALRKQAGLSQVQLANAIGIPQRTLSFYEREGTYIPSTLIPLLAKTLGISIEELLGVDSAKSKRGPKSKLERQLERVNDLPKDEQQFVSKFLDQVLEKHSR